MTQDLPTPLEWYLLGRIRAVYQSSGIGMRSDPHPRAWRGLLPPEWLLLPGWLEAAWRPGPRAGVVGEGAGSGALRRILWGQYALFLFVRLHDDLLDRQRDDRRLLFVADRFLVASLEAFHGLRRLPADFWEVYHNSLDQTLHGILRIRKLERQPGRFGVDDLPLHSGVGAIFRVGASAMAHLRGRPEAFEWITAFQAQIAIASQLGDDLMDLPEDLTAGRFTYPANRVLGLDPRTLVTPEEALRRLPPALLDPRGTAPVLAEMERALTAASEALPDDAPPPLRAWLQRLTGEFRAGEIGMHETRVRSVFGSVIEG